MSILKSPPGQNKLIYFFSGLLQRQSYTFTLGVIFFWISSQYFLPGTIEYLYRHNYLAKMIGVSEMTVINWEKGGTKPNKQSLERLEKILGNLPSS